MNTVVNNPNTGSDGSGAWTVVGIIIGIIVVLILLYYGVPALRNTPPAEDGTGVNVNVTLPKGTGGGGPTE